MISTIQIEPYSLVSKERKEFISKKICSELKINSCCIVSCDYISNNDNNRVISILRKLFERPHNHKLAYISSEPLMPGFSPYGRSKALDTGIKNTLETWDIDLLKPVKFPEEMVDDWEFLVNYQSRVFDLVTDFFQFLSIGFNISASNFSDIINKDNGGIHFIHYLPFEESFHPEARRQSKHFDMTLITVIPPSNEDGLEVELNGVWMPIQLKANEFLIQVGLILERMFGKSIKASLHTVETYEWIKTKHRYAFPYFVSPSGDTKIAVIKEYGSSEILDRYPDDFVKNINSEYYSKIFKPDR